MRRQSPAWTSALDSRPFLRLLACSSCFGVRGSVRRAIRGRSAEPLGAFCPVAPMNSDVVLLAVLTWGCKQWPNAKRWLGGPGGPDH